MASPVETEKTFLKISSVKALSSCVRDLYPKEVVNLTDVFLRVKNTTKNGHIFLTIKTGGRRAKMSEEAELLALISLLRFLYHVRSPVGKAKY